MNLRPKFLAISTGALLVAALGSLSLVREIDRARGAGVQLEVRGGEAVVVGYEHAGSRGLEVRDRVVAVDGRPLLELESPSEALAKRPGPAHLLVMRRGVPRSVEFFPAPVHPDWHYLFLALVGVATLGIVLGALRRAPLEPGILLFASAALAFSAILLLTPVRYDTVGRWLFAAEELARAFAPPLLAHFAVRAPDGRRRFRAAPFLYLPALVLLVAEADLYLGAGRLLPIPAARAIPLFDRLFFLHLGAAVLAAIALWSLRLATSPSGETGRRLRWLLAGAAGGVLPVAVLSGFPRVFGPDFEFIRTLALPGLALVPLGAAAALVRFRLQEVDRAIARAAAAAVSTLVALVVFGSANLLIAQLLPVLGEAPRHLASFTAGFATIAVLAPARRRISDFVLKLQHRAGEKEREALVAFSREMAIHDEPARLGESLLDRLRAAVPLAAANLWVADDSGALVAVRPPKGFPATVAPSRAADLLGAPEAGARVSLPMISRGRLVGWLVVDGEDGLPPDTADRALLEALASSAAVALDNSRLYRDLAREHDRVRQMAEFNERVLESAGSALAVVDGEGLVLAANSRLAGWLGLPRETLAGRRLEILFPPASRARAGAGEVEVRWTPSGEERERVLVLRSEPLSGAPGTTVVAASDVTEADTLRRELAARERLAAVGLVAASVAHEVNTPLAGISSWAQMLMDDTPADDPRHAVLEKIEGETFRASRLVRDVLDMARGGPVARVPLDLREVALSALATVDRPLSEARVAIETDFPPARIPVSGDAVRLERAVVNLLLNAKDAAPGGRVRISAGLDADGAFLTVADDGRGMEPEERARAFELLFSTKGSNGTGLGLALAAEVVRAHGGRIALDSVPGRGTAVTIRIPTAEAAS